jgi:uncharacterized protein YjbJ (UPF0337 family)
MKTSTKDRIEGKYHEAKGAVKEKVGSVAGNPVMEAKGQDEKIAGKLQNKIGQVEKARER